ncbi:hypothetical protein K2173_023687 [Erythroxylum novogranatense]|uniref:Endonuclease/exonuclease/phosphatase domain-containing protein n=1 Tax=Erythroxylum novogranatense TaxID=1862640 RepID=A0AAV8TSL5_9ROSI|nr:hypothetical protein K2173_023687 [Erythroxylum novogranatense]
MWPSLRCHVIKTEAQVWVPKVAEPVTAESGSSSSLPVVLAEHVLPAVVSDVPQIEEPIVQVSDVPVSPQVLPSTPVTASSVEQLEDALVDSVVSAIKIMDAKVGGGSVLATSRAIINTNRFDAIAGSDMDLRVVEAAAKSPKKIRAAAVGAAEVKCSNARSIVAKWFPGWSFLCNYEYAVNGRIWILWKPGILIQSIAASDQSITCSFRSGLHPWFIVGDFNIIADPSESSSSQLSSQLLHDMDDFKEWMCAAGVQDHPFLGSTFTWTNNQCDGFLARKLDRVLVSGDWFGVFDRSGVEFLAPHSLCSQAFQVFNFWTRHPDFLAIVEDSWKVPIAGSPMLRLFLKLKRLKVVLRRLNKECYADISPKVLTKRKELDDLQLKVLRPNVDIPIVEQTVKVYKEYRALLLVEESFYKQKSGVQCIKEGDANTKFYHCSVKSQLCKSQIRLLLNEQGDYVDTKAGLAEVVVSYFSKLLGEKDPHVIVPDLSLLRDLLPGSIGETKKLMLVQDISRDEVRKVMFALGGEKAPGPDGYSAHFFQVAWSVVGDDVCDAVFEFFQSGLVLPAFNSTIVALVSKKPNFMSIKDYRPISRCSTFYKCLTKIMVARLVLYYF